MTIFYHKAQKRWLKNYNVQFFLFVYLVVLTVYINNNTKVLHKIIHDLRISSK